MIGCYSSSNNRPLAGPSPEVVLEDGPEPGGSDGERDEAAVDRRGDEEGFQPALAPAHEAFAGREGAIDPAGAVSTLGSVAVLVAGYALLVRYRHDETDGSREGAQEGASQQ